jgi:DNA polymerase III delta prime subunit
MVVNDDDMIIVPSDYESLYEGEEPLFRRQVRALKRGDSVLIKKGLFQLMDDDGRAHSDALILTSYVCEELLQDMGIVNPIKKDNFLTSHSEIVAKELFYNPKEERSLSQLRLMLAPEQFDNICNRLDKKGMRKGFACLFYGAPGTGKTETVLQLARQTGRDIMQVNISEINSKWVGESEKNIKALFDRYRRLVKDRECAPILFFNEADAIFGKRMENVESSAAQMLNSLQNIILQEMETLDGVMICTTNLHGNLDPAFERRFLYKIELEKPGEEVRSKIWRTMMKGLSDEEYAILARQYSFSGGQIENVVRKSTVDYILSGTKPTLEDISKFCDEENFKSKIRKVGFVG